MNVLERRTLGSALQRGLMSIAGHFDAHVLSCGCCHVAPSVPLADWAVTSFGVRRGQAWVEGLNLNCAPGEYGHRFRWYFDNATVAFGDWRYRFELCPQAEGPLQ